MGKGGMSNKPKPHVTATCMKEQGMRPPHFGPTAAETLLPVSRNSAEKPPAWVDVPYTEPNVYATVHHVVWQHYHGNTITVLVSCERIAWVYPLPTRQANTISVVQAAQHYLLGQSQVYLVTQQA